LVRAVYDKGMRDVFKVLAVAVAVLLLGFLGYQGLFGEGASDGLRVSQVQGDVFVVGAERTLAELGDVLGSEETLEAGAGGRAVLSFGGGGELTLEPETKIRVLPSQGDGLRIELDGGRIQATVRDGSPLGIVSGSREVRADGRAAFQVARSQGSTYVSAQEGALNLRGFGDITELNADEVVVAPDGGSPRLDPASRALLLEVEWPSDAVRRERLPVQGRADAGSSVALRVDGEVASLVEVDADGEWQAEVLLKEGPNVLQVEITDPLGRTQTLEQVVDLDTTPPKLTVEVAVSGG
jgi:hypothetical protein